MELKSYCEMCGRKKALRIAKDPSGNEKTLCSLCASGSAELLAEKQVSTPSRFTDPAYLKAERKVARVERSIRRNVR